MTRKLILAATIAASVLSGGVAFAQAAPRGPAPAYNDAPSQPPPPPPRRGLMRADANHDGVITRQEAMAEAGRRFDKLDRNRDGKLDATEMTPRGHRGGRERGPRGGADMPPPPPPADDGE